MEIIISFQSVSHTICAEKILMDLGINASVMPLPSAIKAGCGLCLRVGQADYGKATGFLKAAGVLVEGYFIKQGDGKIVNFENCK